MTHRRGWGGSLSYRPALAGAAALVLLGAVTGCTGEPTDGDDIASADGTSAAAEESATAESSADGVSPADLPSVPELADAVGARGDVTFGACATTPGDAVVTFSITNSAAEARTYSVVVSWTSSASDVLARGVALVEDVEPAETLESEVTATVPDGATSCTFRVEATSTAG